MKYCCGVVAILALFLASGCDLINPSEPVPTYVRIDSFTVKGNELQTGSNSHKITSVYAYLNNQSLGTFDLPALFPVILDKSGKILLTAGIDKNGISSYPAQYPFYTSDTFTLTAAPGTTVTYAPKVRYFDSAKVQFYVDFDGTPVGAVSATNPFKTLEGDTTVKTTGKPEEVFEGAHSGIIALYGNADTSVSINTNPFKLPPNKDIYLEMDYKSTVPLTVGLNTNTAGDEHTAYLVGFYPRSTWGKVYISLRSFASTYQGKDFYLLLRAVKDKPGDGYVLIDNLKIVSF